MIFSNISWIVCLADKKNDYLTIFENFGKFLSLDGLNHVESTFSFNATIIRLNPN